MSMQPSLCYIFSLAHSSVYFIRKHAKMHKAQEHGTEICQMWEWDIILLFPVETLAVLFVSLCRIPAVVSFLEGLRALPGTVPLTLPGPPFIPTTIFKTAGIQSKHLTFYSILLKPRAALLVFCSTCLVMRWVWGEEEVFFMGEALNSCSSRCLAHLVSIITFLTSGSTWLFIGW